MSEDYEKDGKTVKREGKRPKMEREELEAQLEFKITAKAGSHHKLEKVCMQISCCTSPKCKLTEFFLVFMQMDSENFIT